MVTIAVIIIIIITPPQPHYYSLNYCLIVMSREGQ